MNHLNRYISCTPKVNEIQHFPGRSWKAIPRNFIEPELYYLTEDHIGGNDLIAYLAYPPPDTGDSTGYGWIGDVCNRIDVGRRHSLSEKQPVFLNTVYVSFLPNKVDQCAPHNYVILLAFVA